MLLILIFHLLSRLSHVHWVDSSSPFGVRIKLLIYAYTFVRTEKRDGVERGRGWPDSISRRSTTASIRIWFDHSGTQLKSD
jgi:hypothetical protein